MPHEESALESVVCPSCGATNAAKARFCSTCGSRLAEAPPPREERKLVSVLFVDLVGFTARSERADPEDVREALQLYHSEAKQRIEHHGGVLEKFTGDAVMAVFGAPVAHGDDAERAVRAGLRVLEGIDELNQEHALDLAARAAVNTGEAVVSLDGAQGDALATGDVVNTASRLQGAATEGRLLVGAETYRATRQAIRYEPFPLVEAKGKEEAVGAWLAVESLVRPRWQARASHGQVAQTVGDDAAAATAYDQAGALIESFAATLAPERAARLLAAPAVDEILSLAGRRSTA